MHLEIPGPSHPEVEKGLNSRLRQIIHKNRPNGRVNLQKCICSIAVLSSLIQNNWLSKG
jgi:hypothetical protein